MIDGSQLSSAACSTQETVLIAIRAVLLAVGLARPEGFEPPTLRSEVRSSSFSQQTAKKKSPFFIGERAFSFLSLGFVTCESGNKVETKTGTVSVYEAAREHQ